MDYAATMASRYLILFGIAAALAASASARSAAPATAPSAAPARDARPAEAPASATRIPEPDTIALFLMGATGLIVGRRLSLSKRRRQPDA